MRGELGVAAGLLKACWAVCRSLSVVPSAPRYAATPAYCCPLSLSPPGLACSARREAERIQKELEEREQEELKAYMASRGRKVGEGEKLDAKTINKVRGRWVGGCAAGYAALHGGCCDALFVL